VARVIQFDEADGRALLDRLELQKFRPPQLFDDLVAAGKLTEAQKLILLVDFHRHFHYEVCRWLQEQGADVARP